jgi:DNA invertase Pin-like site-specific DNA recombinase
MRAALYCRVSTTEQTNANQLLQLRQFAQSQAWNVVAEYCDEISGAKGEKNRPAFREMFVAASRREFDVLIFWSLDRLSREGVLPTLQYLNRLSSYGIKWRSFTELYIDSCGVFADAVISIMAVIARQENIRRSERTKAGLARARAQGRPLGRRRVQVDRDLIQQLRAAGLSWDAISVETGISRSCCQRAVHPLEEQARREAEIQKLSAPACG